MDIYFILWDIIEYYFIFIVQIVLILVIESSYSWLLCQFDIPITVGFFDHFLLELQMLQGYLVYFLPQSQNQPFLQEVLVPFIEE